MCRYNAERQEYQQRQAQDKRYEIKGTNGLVLEVVPGGKKYWRLRYSYKNKDCKLTLGEYPLISLKEARELCKAGC